MCTPTGNRTDDSPGPPLRRFSVAHVPVLLTAGLAGLVVFLLVRLALRTPDFDHAGAGLVVFSGLVSHCMTGRAEACGPADMMMIAGLIAVLPTTYWIATRELAETRGIAGGVAWATLVTFLVGIGALWRSPADILAMLASCATIAAAFEFSSDLLRLTFHETSGSSAA
jgi:hypothetical protein